MEYKIDMSKVFGLLNNFINDTFSYDYRHDSFKINIALNDYYKNLLNLEKDDLISYLKSNNVICSTKDITLKFITIKDKVLELDSTFILVKNNDNNAAEQYTCRLTLIETNDDYVITSIHLLTKEGVLNYGFHLVDLLKKKVRIAKPEGNKITLALTVRNEANKFISQMLTHAMQYVSNIVILDDASTDNTVKVCEEVLKDFPHKIYKNSEPMMINLKETASKKKLWNLTTKENPDWILFLDADEIFEDWAIDVLPIIVNDTNFDAYYFKIFHMWEDDNHYRADGLWAPVDYRIYLVRYQPNYEYKWHDMGLHCYRHPYNIYDMPGCCCYVRLKHYGHFTKEIRKAKYERYKLLDPNADFVPKSHYDSILEEAPVLKEF